MQTDNITELKADPQSECKPFLVISHDINKSDEQLNKQTEEVTFVSFLSDSDPSFLLVLTYSPATQSSYMKLLKIFN